MARNPYAGLGSADPYTNGNASRSASTDDYGAPPGSSSSSTRQRPGGYGGFNDDGNGAAPAVQPTSSRPSQDSVRPRPSQDSARPRPSQDSARPRPSQDSARGEYGYGGRSTPAEQAPPRSPRRPRMAESQSSTERRRKPDGSGDSGRMEFRRPERQYTNGSGGQSDMVTPRARGAGSRSNIPGGGGDGTKQIEDVLQYIQSEWAFMAQDKCVPVQVALQLMDSSSLGRAHQYDQFQDTHQQLQRALKAIVNEYHQGFNSSIGTFHKIQSSIQASQSRVRVLKESLGEAKISLSTTRPELKGLATTSQSYEDMLHALGQIEQLRSVTDNLEARISEKRFLTAVDVLQDALRMLRKPEMDNIGALSDLRVYLANQETSLTDILIEELHSHLYLKSPYCQDRWKAHAKAQSNGASSEGGDGAAPAVQPLYQFLDDLDVSKIMVEDASRNPEADSFYYIQLLIEALNKMGRLDVAVNSIEQRLPVELFRVVDKTNSEVDQRHPSSLRGNLKNTGRLDHNLSDNDGRAIVMYDLLWTLYAKFEAIAEGHRVLHDVVSGILKRDGTRNSGLTGGFKELWKLYQNEMRSLLHDYLATDGNIYRSGQVTEDPSSVFRRNQRDKNKRLFKLSDMDAKSMEMTTELEDLEAILKASVPGLVSDRRPDGNAVDEHQQQTDGAATGHKLLIEPSVFNMGLLLPPSLSFLQRLKEIVPPGSDIVMSTLTSFLDDFLVNVFHPQLDETLVELSSQIFVELDAFQEDPQWSQKARRPVFKGSSAFFNLITTFCRMLDTIPHDQAFSQLIITQMVTYYDKCCDWLKLLVSRSQEQVRNGSSLKTSAALASGPGEIHDTLQKLWTAEGGDEDKILLEKETGLLILQTNETPVHMVDILSDRKTIASLALLYTSMKWLASKIEKLRHITRHDTDSSRTIAIRGAHKRRWTLLNDPTRVGDGKGPVYLPMTLESVVAFDGIVSSFQELAGTVLLTLHTEIRIQIIHSLNQALSPTTAPYLLEQAVNDPDPTILTLNNDLVIYDDTATIYLPPREMSFLRTGLGHLISSLLVTNAAAVGTMNKNGCGRMLLNILVLQQNLKNIEPGTDLARAKGYFEMFNDGADGIVARAKEEGEKLGYGYDELKVLIELCYSEPLASPERGISTVANRKMGESLLALSEYMWQT